MHVTDKDRGMHVTDDGHWRTTAERTRDTAEDLARRSWEQAGAAGEQLYHAGEYVTEKVKAYPAMALLVAGAVGYGIAYLIHAGNGPSRQHYKTGPAFLGNPDKMRRDRVPHRGEVIGRDVPDESKERHTEIAVDAGRSMGGTAYRR